MIDRDNDDDERAVVVGARRLGRPPRSPWSLDSRRLTVAPMILGIIGAKLAPSWTDDDWPNLKPLRPEMSAVVIGCCETDPEWQL